MELALVRAGIEPVLAEASEYLFDVLTVLLGVVGVDEDVVEVDDHADVEHVREDVVDEPLKSSGCVRKSERHD